MIDPRPILALLDLPDGEREILDSPSKEELISDAIREVVRATNAELERMVREMFARFGRDYTEQDIAAVLARPVEISVGPRPAVHVFPTKGTHTPCGGKFVGEETAESAPYCPRCQINIYAASTRGEVTP